MLMSSILEAKEEAEKIEIKYQQLLNDKQYIRELISDMLDNEDKKDTPENRKQILNSASFKKYLMNIAKTHVKS